MGAELTDSADVCAYRAGIQLVHDPCVAELQRIYSLYTRCKYTRQRMVRKIYKTGHSLVITLPKDALERLDLHEGSAVSVSVDETGSKLIIEPAQPAAPGVDPKFAAQLDDFIEQYRPALEALAK